MRAPFGAPFLWVVSPHPGVSSCLRTFVELVCGSGLPHELMILDRPTIRHPEQLREHLDKQDLSTLFNSAVVLDLTGTAWDSDWTIGPFANTALPVPQQPQPAELVLRYPEVYWIFVVTKVVPFNSEENLHRQLIAKHFVTVHDLTRLVDLLNQHASGFRTLFDPTGLRRWISSPLKKKDGHKTNTKPQLAASLEDEETDCVLNGYYLYRSGFSSKGEGSHTYLVPTCAQLRYVDSVFRHSSGRPWRVIEDVELNYADLDATGLEDKFLMPKRGETIIRMMEERERKWGICDSKEKIVVSTLRAPDPDNPELPWVTKPYSGFYDERFAGQRSKSWWHRPLRRLEYFQKDLRCFACHVWNSVTGKKGKQKQSLKTALRNYKDSPDYESHSASSQLEEVATRLLERAENSKEMVATPRDAVQTAVLGHLAEYLLEGKTPQMSLDALALRHRAEVQAECLYVGASTELDVMERVDDILASVGRITRYSCFDRLSPKWKKRRKQRCNAMVWICGELRDIYHSHYQCEEEGALLGTIRRWERKAWLANRGERRIRYFQKPWSLLWFYINTLLKGWPIAAFSLFWIAAFAFAYYGISISPRPTGTPTPHMCWRDWATESAATFVGLQQSLEGATGAKSLAELAVQCDGVIKQEGVTRSEVIARLHWFRLLIVVEMGFGYFHLGVFVAWILDKSSKK